MTTKQKLTTPDVHLISLCGGCGDGAGDKDSQLENYLSTRSIKCSVVCCGAMVSDLMNLMVLESFRPYQYRLTLVKSLPTHRGWIEFGESWLSFTRSTKLESNLTRLRL